MVNENEYIVELENILSEFFTNLAEIKCEDRDLFECVAPIMLVAAMYVVEKRYNFSLTEEDLIYENFKTYNSFKNLLVNKVRQ